ncbi:MAG TPA: hypothetical protein VLJ59_15560, partial [Mycobacteriales bacterium]|nr:hypothetical protein [Mycobacteriales bacterium]
MGHEQFRREMDQLRGGLSYRRFAEQIHYDAAQVNRVANGRQRPSYGLAKALDMHAGGERFVALLLDETRPVHHAGHTRRDAGSPWEVLEVIRRLRSSDLGAGTVDSLGHATHELCRQYPYRPAAELRTDSLELLRMVARLRAGRLTYAEHRELLNTAAWLTLLVGCVEYDMGMKAAGETSRDAAASIGRETGNDEVQAWAHEMASWFALTQGRLDKVIDHAREGRSLAPNSGVAVQLAAQEAKARARLGDEPGMRAALDAGRRALDNKPAPAHPEHHFVIDPDKWNFYAMDCYRVTGMNELTAEHATEVLRVGRMPDGSDRWPMRTAEARVALAVVAVRSGDLERTIG